MEPTKFIVGDIFKVFDKDLDRHRFVVLSRFVFQEEHFVLISLSSFERWTDRELSFQNQFTKTRLSSDEILYLLGEDELNYCGNINQIRDELFQFVNKKLSDGLAIK